MILCIVGFIIVALVVASNVLSRTREEAEERYAKPQEAISPYYLFSSEEPDLRYNPQLTPGLFQEQILQPALSCQPGTAGSSLKAAYASARVLDFVTSNHLYLTEQEYINQIMADAVALLTEEERSQLQETLPGLFALIEETIEIYPENSGLYDDAGCYDLIENALRRSYVAENWARLKTAFDVCIPAAKNTDQP